MDEEACRLICLRAGISDMHAARLRARAAELPAVRHLQPYWLLDVIVAAALARPAGTARADFLAPVLARELPTRWHRWLLDAVVAGEWSDAALLGATALVQAEMMTCDYTYASSYLASARALAAAGADPGFEVPDDAEPPAVPVLGGGTFERRGMRPTTMAAAEAKRAAFISGSLARQAISLAGPPW